MPYMTPDRFITAIKKTPVMLNALLKDVSQEQAVRSTDGPDGWSVVETLCHMVDFEEISFVRIKGVRKDDHIPFAPFDHHALAEQRDYKNRDLREEFEKYIAKRREVIALFAELSEDEWAHRGIHGTYGEMSLVEYALHISWHDVNHIEQITRSLGLSDFLVG